MPDHEIIVLELKIAALLLSVFMWSRSIDMSTSGFNGRYLENSLPATSHSVLKFTNAMPDPEKIVLELEIVFLYVV